MKQSIIACLLLAAAAPLGAQAPVPAIAPPSAPPGGAAAPAADANQISYWFGLSFGEQMHNVGITDQVSIDAVARGLKDGLKGNKTTSSDRQQVQSFVQSILETAVTRNQTAAKEFLARNGRDKNVITTASGLEYKIIAPGDRKAAAITPTDTVTVQYRGKLLDGSEFDSSYERGAPASFTVNGVIPGWQEALVLMKPGAKWQLFIPPELAYRTTPRPGIPGGSLLIFDVELLSAKQGGATTAAPPN
jgi:FKBP-type peptidyl-prolyl cis-trans isomerase FklB